MIFSPSNSLIFSATPRPTMVVLPPGAKGMTSVIGRVGKFCACAELNAAAIAAMVMKSDLRIDMDALPASSLLLRGMVAETRVLRNPTSGEPIFTPSFRDGAKHQTRNLEILRGARAPHSSMLRIAPE